MFSANCILALLIVMATIYSSESDTRFGAPVDMDPKDPKYQKLAVDSLKQYEDQKQLTSHYAVLAVGRVTSSVVAGTKTIIDFFAAATVCTKVWYAYVATNCPLDNLSDTLYCRSEIWRREWLKKTQITVNCNKALAWVGSLITFFILMATIYSPVISVICGSNIIIENSTLWTYRNTDYRYCNLTNGMNLKKVLNVYG